MDDVKRKKTTDKQVMILVSWVSTTLNAHFDVRSEEREIIGYVRMQYGQHSLLVQSHLLRDAKEVVVAQEKESV